MAQETIDFSKVDTFELIDQGRYLCRLFDVKKKVTQAGDPMYVLSLKIQNGDFKGRQLFYNLPVMEKTLWKIKQALEVFGVEVPKGPLTFDFSDHLGAACVATVSHRVYNGKTVEDIIDIQPANVDAVDIESTMPVDEVPF